MPSLGRSSVLVEPVADFGCISFNSSFPPSRPGSTSASHLGDPPTVANEPFQALAKAGVLASLDIQYFNEFQ